MLLLCLHIYLPVVLHIHIYTYTHHSPPSLKHFSSRTNLTKIVFFFFLKLTKNKKNRSNFNIFFWKCLLFARLQKNRVENKRGIFSWLQKRKLGHYLKIKYCLNLSIYLSIYPARPQLTVNRFLFLRICTSYITHTYKYIKEPNEATYLLLVEVSFN